MPICINIRRKVAEMRKQKNSFLPKRGPVALEYQVPLQQVLLSQVQVNQVMVQPVPLDPLVQDIEVRLT